MSVVTHLGRISFRLPSSRGGPRGASARPYTGLYAIQDGYSMVRGRVGGTITMNFDRPVPNGSGDCVHGITIGVVLVPGLQEVLDDGEKGSDKVASQLIGEWCAANVRARA